MEDKQRALHYFMAGGKIIFSMDEVFRDMKTSVRVALDKEEAGKLLTFLRQTLVEDGYRFVPDSDGLLACEYCVFPLNSTLCHNHPCTSVEREDGQDGHWEKA